MTRRGFLQSLAILAGSLEAWFQRRLRTTTLSPAPMEDWTVTIEPGPPYVSDSQLLVDRLWTLQREYDRLLSERLEMTEHWWKDSDGRVWRQLEGLEPQLTAYTEVPFYRLGPSEPNPWG